MRRVCADAIEKWAVRIVVASMAAQSILDRVVQHMFGVGGE